MPLKSGWVVAGVSFLAWGCCGGNDVKTVPEQKPLEATVPQIPAELEGKTTIAAVVTNVYDGDTFTAKLADGKVEKVRLIGINAPEISAVNGENAARARDYLKDLVADKDVMLALGVRDRDKYGRLLAYVFVVGPEGTIFINEKMVSDGYANAYTVPPNVDYAGRFKDAEAVAREGGKGLWYTPPKPVSEREAAGISEPTKTEDDDSYTVYLTRTGNKYHAAGCRHLRKSAIPTSKKKAEARGYSP